MERTDESSANASDRLSEALSSLGFSSYEARCYAGLLANEPQTGYGVAKITGVPQPKVYEALRKLVQRGAAEQIDGERTLFRVVPPGDLLDSITRTLERTVRMAKDAADELQQGRPAVAPMPGQVGIVLNTREVVVSAARQMIGEAVRRVYVSASSDELGQLMGDLSAAVERGVDVIVLDFARRPVQRPGMRVFHHSSTENSIYRHHQALHVTLVADSAAAINAISVDATRWEGVRTGSPALIAAIKGLIKHDIDLQQIYRDFAPMLVDAYGHGLQELEIYRREDAADARVPAQRSVV